MGSKRVASKSSRRTSDIRLSFLIRSLSILSSLLSLQLFLYVIIEYFVCCAVFISVCWSNLFGFCIDVTVLRTYALMLFYYIVLPLDYSCALQHSTVMLLFPVSWYSYLILMSFCKELYVLLLSVVVHDAVDLLSFTYLICFKCTTWAMSYLYDRSNINLTEFFFMLQEVLCVCTFGGAYEMVLVLSV